MENLPKSKAEQIHRMVKKKKGRTNISKQGTQTRDQFYYFSIQRTSKTADKTY